MAGFKPSLEQQLKQTQTLKLSHQQLMLLKLLEVPAIELEDKIKQEIEENPALEDLSDGLSDRLDDNNHDNDSDDRDDFSDVENGDDYDYNDDYDDRYDFKDSDLPDYDERAEDYLMSRYANEDSNYTEPTYGEAESMLDNLVEQLDFMSGIDPKILRYAKYVLGNLGSNGLLHRTVEQLADDFSFSSGENVNDDDMSEAVELVKTLEPAGVGAQDLRECLLLQLKRKREPKKYVELATRALENCFDDVSLRRMDRVAQKLNLTEEEAKETFSLIASLNPRPYTDNDVLQGQSLYIVPDFEVHAEDGQLVLTVLKGRIPELGVSKAYQEMIETYTKGDKKSLTRSQKDAAMFAKQKVENAEWFIRAIKQRSSTLYDVVSKIVMYQRKYFLSGDKSLLRPMTLKDVAALTKYELSTISRVTNGKYIQTDFGVFALKDLFTDSMTNDDGDDVSTAYIKDMIKKAVEDEDKKSPLTDEQLVAIIAQKGINLARRTVAKYRDQLGIPSTRSRRVVI